MIAALRRTWFIWAALFGLTLIPVGQAAVNYIQQSGSITVGHTSYWISSGVQGDAGPATNGNLTEVGIYRNGGLGFCLTASTVAKVNFNPASSPYTQLCATATQGTTGGFTLNSYNGAANAGFNVNINGTDYSFPAGGAGSGNVTGPNSSVVGDLAVWNATNGQLLADGGTGSTVGGTVSVITGAGTVTATTAQKIIVIDKGTPAATSVVLPSASNWPNCPGPNACPVYYIKDGAGNAITYPITITANDGATFDGQASFIENQNYQETGFILTGTNWSAF